jgi:hypothetical protein
MHAFEVNWPITPQPGVMARDYEAAMAENRRVVWGGIGLCFLSGIGVILFLPSSPLNYRVVFTKEGIYNDHTTHHWVEQLHNPDPELRSKAAFNLGQIGADAPEAVAPLCEMLHDPDRMVRGNSVLSLLKMCPVCKSAVPALIEALDDEEPVVRLNVVMVFARLGVDARQAIPALLKALDKPDNRSTVNGFYRSHREMIALALGKASAGTTDAVGALTTMLSDENPNMRSAAIQGLGDVGEKASTAAPQLRKMLADDKEDRHVKDVLRENLPKIQPKESSSN